MKEFVFLLFALFVSFSVFAQPETDSAMLEASHEFSAEAK